MNCNIEELFANAQADPSLLSTVNIDELLDALLEDEKNDYLEDKTHENIAEDILNSLSDLEVYSPETLGRLSQSLLEYRYVDKINDLHAGKAIKWLKISPLETDEIKVKMKSGAICGGVRFRDDGTYVLCVSINGKNFFQLKYDDFLIYQKLSVDEQMILMLNAYVQTHS